MAQSATALREPTMDEILTSIREIIEENTLQSERIHNAHQAQAANSFIAEPAQDSPSLSVEEAMLALAERIGLTDEAPDNGHIAQSSINKALSPELAPKEGEVGVAKTAPVQDASSGVDNKPELAREPAAENTIDKEPANLTTESEVSKLIAQILHQQTAMPSVPADKPNVAEEADHKTDEAPAPQPIKQIDEALFFGNIEMAAANVLRPLISQWLKSHLAALVNKILLEEIDKLSPSKR